MNDEQATAYYTLLGEMIGHWPDMFEPFACDLAEFVIKAGYRQVGA
jgi:hypothetical protein